MIHTFPKNIRLLLYASLLLCILTALGHASTAKKQFNQVYDIEPDTKLSVSTQFSSVTVKPWANQQIRIEADIKTFGRSYREAQTLLDKIKIAVSSGDSLFEVMTHLPQLPAASEKKGFWARLSGAPQEQGVTIILNIYVPEDTDIHILTSNGPIQIEDISGSIHAETTEQPITVENIRGAVSAYTTNAPVSAQLNALSGEDIELSTNNADINLILPEEAQTTIQAQAYEGSVRSEFNLTKCGPFTEQTKYGWVNGGGVLVNLYTVQGSIYLKKR